MPLLNIAKSITLLGKTADGKYVIGIYAASSTIMEKDIFVSFIGFVIKYISF